MASGAYSLSFGLRRLLFSSPFATMLQKLPLINDNNGKPEKIFFRNFRSSSRVGGIRLKLAIQHQILSTTAADAFISPSVHLFGLKPGRITVSQRQLLASRPYATWILSGFSRSSSSQLQPYLEVEDDIANIRKHEEVMKKRQMIKKPDLTQLADLFQKAKDLKLEVDRINKEKDANAAEVKEILRKTPSDDKASSTEIQALREKGRDLRDEARKALIKFQEVNEAVVGLILAIPNQLDPVTPLQQYKSLRSIPVKAGVEGFKIPSDFPWEYISHIGPGAEFSLGPGAMLELEVATVCQKFLLAQGFTETGNVDFVKRILLDGTGLDPKRFLKVREMHSNSGRHHATYLVGGATFPAFLALFAQSVIQQIDALPIRYFVIGRTYTKSEDSEMSSIQDTVVQVFVACKNRQEEEEEFSKLLQTMGRFYSEEIGIKTASHLAPAPDLETYEKKRVMFIQDETDKVVGHLTTTGDYVSKRLLCCYNDRRIPKFLHLLTGQFFNITNFVRPKIPHVPEVENNEVNIKAEAEALALTTKSLAPEIEKTDPSLAENLPSAEEKTSSAPATAATGEKPPTEYEPPIKKE